MTIEIRPLEPHDHRAASDTVSAALMGRPLDDDAWAASLPSWEDMPGFSAWDGDRCVGNVGQWVVDTVVPGGARLATGGVTRVAVLPTHRRQGLATRLMHELIADGVERGLALQILHASDAKIYERFGFGLASESCLIGFDPRHAEPIRGGEAGGSFRMLRPDETDELLPALYDRVARRRVGSISRCGSWWHRITGPTARTGKASFVVVHTDERGVDDGYVHYETAWDPDHSDPNGNGEVHDLFAASDAVELALWQYVCGVDLVTRWKSWRPVDDLMHSATHDPRARRVRALDDELWVRLLDVEVALGARTFAPVAAAINIAVTDPLVSGNSGTWQVSGDGARRIRSAPDLVTDVAGLSATYLGGASWYALVASDRATVATPGAVEVADALFRSTPQPWCGTMF